MSRDERLQLGDHILVQTQGDFGLEPLLERIESKLLETPDLGLRPRLVLDVRKGSAAPQSERGSECLCCVARLLAASLLEQTLEFVCIGVGDPEQVPGPA